MIIIRLGYLSIREHDFTHIRVIHANDDVTMTGNILQQAAMR